MPSLAELQAEFAAALVDPKAPVPPALRRPAARRFAVHRNNRAAALVEALEAGFPALRRLVGPAFFAAAARAYVDRHPPRSPVMLLYGEGFGGFLDSFPPAAGVPYLGDVARLEWARLAAYHAGDAAPLALGRLAAVPATALPTLRLSLHPSLHLLRSRFPVATLWQAASGGDRGPVDMTRGEAVAVLRPGLSVAVRVLPAGGFTFLTTLAAGATLGEAAAAALTAAPDTALADHLQGLFDLGAAVALAPSLSHASGS